MDKKTTSLPFLVAVEKDQKFIELGFFPDFLQAFQFACVVSKHFNGYTLVMTDSHETVSTLTSNLFKDASK